MGALLLLIYRCVDSPARITYHLELALMSFARGRALVNWPLAPLADILCLGGGGSGERQCACDR